VSDSDSITLLELSSLNVYAADIFNGSRHRAYEAVGRRQFVIGYEEVRALP
jgi:hypothetical protein